MNKFPIGIFDSDIGGLSVVDEFRRISPYEDIIYFADTANYPYGTKQKEQVVGYFDNIVNFLLNKKVKALLCACSTASAVAVPLYAGRLKVDLIGMFNERLVTYVQEVSKNHNIALIATELTVKSKGFENLFKNVSEHFEIKSKPASKLVNLITNCDFSPNVIMPEIKNVLKDFDLKNTGALIIGCTHFYHITDFLSGYLNGIPIIEPAKIAVSCLNDIINDKKLSKEDTSAKGITRCYVSGDLNVFKDRVKTLEVYHKRIFIDEFLEAK